MTNKNMLCLLGVLIAVWALSFVSGCGTTTANVDAVATAIDADTSVYDVGVSDPAGTLALAVTAEGTRPYIWYRTFNLVSPPTISVISNDGSTAIAQVTRTVSGVLTLLPTGSATVATKNFSQSYSRYVELTSANGGISWTRKYLTPGLTKSTVSAGSVASDLTISRMVIKDLTASGEVTLFDVTAEASASGPWFGYQAPLVNAGDTLEVSVYASRTGDTIAPWVYVWPGIDGVNGTATGQIFRRPLFDDKTHGDTTKFDGLYVNTTQPLSIPAGEASGLRSIHIGVFSDKTLEDATSPYDFSSWHFLYRVR